jgi:P4 family phage/plasmid primase-like protien
MNKDVYDLNANAYAPIIYKGKKKRFLPKNHEYEYDDLDKIQEDIKMACELVPLLSIERSEGWEEWTQIGIYIFNIAKGGEKGFELWYEFSQRAESARIATEDECRKIWDGFYDIGIDIRALENLVRHDNIDGFRRYQKRNSHRCLLWIPQIQHYDVALSLYELYPDDFVYTKDKTWYVYNNNGWECAPEGMALRSLLSTELWANHNELKKRIKNDMKTPNVTEDRMDALTLACSNIGKVLSSLKQTAFKNNVIKECTELYYDAHFLNKLDANPDLIRCKNGVMDLDEGFFRPGRPTDYVHKTTGISYVEFDSRNTRMQHLETYLQQVFPDPTLREYFKNYSSEILRGFNFRKIFSVWAGDGDNSKSVMIGLFEKILGEYMIKLPTSLVTGKRTQSSAASPELIRTKGTRFAIIQEPSKTDSLNAGIIKEYTGNDSFYCRGLFADGADITPLFKLAMICNDLPSNTDNDPAFWARMRVLPFESCFTHNAPESLDEQIRLKRFPKDPNFTAKLESMAEPFFYMLVMRYLKIKNKNYFEPDKVKNATETYKRNNDVYLQFIADNIIVDPEHVENLQIIYNRFKDWFKDSFPNMNLPNKGDLREQLNRKWKNESVGNSASSWIGFRLRSAQDDMEETKKIKEENKAMSENLDKTSSVASENGDEKGDEKGGEVKKDKPPRRANSVFTMIKTNKKTGKRVKTRWLVGNDSLTVGRVEGVEPDIELVEDRVGNSISDLTVYDKCTGAPIGQVMGSALFSYIDYDPEQMDSKKNVRKQKKIKKNTNLPSWNEEGGVDCMELDCTVDVAIRTKVKKAVKILKGGGKKDDEKKTKLKVKNASPENVFVINNDIDGGGDSESSDGGGSDSD